MGKRVLPVSCLVCPQLICVVWHMHSIVISVSGNILNEWHKDDNWDPDAEAKYQELKELHEAEIEKHGEDNLTVFEAFSHVLKEGQGYVRGLGYGPRPLKKNRIEGETRELQERLTNEIQQLQETQNTLAHQEAALRTQIEELKTSNVHLKSSNEDLKLANERLREDIKHHKEDSIKREYFQRRGEAIDQLENKEKSRREANEAIEHQWMILLPKSRVVIFFCE